VLAGLNVAVIFWSPVIETRQTSVVPWQAVPLQLAKVDGEVGLAVRVTVVLAGKSNVQAEPQLMPVGLLVTVPLPAIVIVSFLVAEGDVNVAVTVWSVFMPTWQAPVPVQPPPLQPAKVAGAVGLAVSVTGVLIGKANIQVGLQLMPAGVLVTVPLPVMFTVRFFVVAGVVKVAVTVWSAFMETTQVPVPEQAPLQPVKVAGAVGLAVSVTAVLMAKVELQIVGQLMPAGELVTVPAPLMVTVRFLVTVGVVKFAVTV
jgi:hypothetical protein